MSLIPRSLSLVGLIAMSALAARPLPAQQNRWLGKQVFWKEDARAKIDTTSVDINTVNFPARVSKIEGDWLWLGNAWVRAADVMLLDEALKHYSEQVRRNPQSAAAWVRRGTCWRAQGDFAKALRDFDAAIRLDPSHKDVYAGRADIKASLGDFTGAIRDYDEALRLDPKNWAVYNNRALAKSDLRDHAGAIRDFDAALRLNPKNAYAYSNRAWARFLTGDYAGAIADYEENARLEPKSADPPSNLAFIRATCPDAELRDGEAALRDAERAIELAPRSGYAWNAKACALAARGDFKGALAALQKALEDKDFAADDSIDGGKRASERRQHWQNGELWLTRPADEPSSPPSA